REASKATTIMQKFIKGSEADGIPPMPVVIGMSATTQRFNTLVEGTASTIHKSIVTADEVRSSGLLKDRIVITYPEEGAVNNDMAILQAAADDWKEKWEHWTQYCYEQHYAYVNPVLIIQVLNGSGSKLTDTNLDDCLAKIEERAGVKFENGQVVHTFGGTTASLIVNGLEVRYEEPSRIADDRHIRVVFFKENLSTGWDCPRAETMMSFRHATDATYIAQLLGRMVRTPMQMHIQVDEVLNDVHLYLPYFNEATVKDVVEALQSAEGSNIPTDIYGEPLSGKTFDTLTVKPKKKDKVYPGQMSIDDFFNPTTGLSNNPSTVSNSGNIPEQQDQKQQDQSVVQNNPFQDTTESDEHESVFSTNPDKHERDGDQESVQQSQSPENSGSDTQNGNAEAPEVAQEEAPEREEDLFDREAVMKFINDAGLLSYNVRSLRINDYLKSLYRMAHFLSMSKLHREAIREVQNEIAEMIHDYVEDLKAKNKYDDLVKQVKQFKLATQIFDAFGETVDNYSVHDLFTTTDTDIERQFQIADTKLGREGIGLTYINKYADMYDLAQYKVDVILFVADEECMNRLHTYAEERFHGMNDDYRRYIATIDSERLRRDYDSIVSDGDPISKHNFRLPETIQVPHDAGGKEYRTHLFVGESTGTAKMKLNSWEEGVIAEEEKRDDFVCWIRNPSRASWALCIPYEIEGEIKPAYPDFIVVRKDERTGYVIDILEPHSADFKDNLGKAKGFAEYARQNPGVGRIQIIRMSKDAAGNNQFKRLDMYRTAIRDKVSHAINTDELDHIFDTDGFFG
ncbi:MAG: restriction endonuclease subunit R, partial [Eubacteriales bacterium]|nr:restriction endonuclease subunit R [Eubacteriales bacterium]